MALCVAPGGGGSYINQRATLLYPHHRDAGCDEGLIGDYAANSSSDRLDPFSVDLAHSDRIQSRAAICSPEKVGPDPSSPQK